MKNGMLSKPAANMVSPEPMHSVLLGGLEALEQAQELLGALNQTQYSYVALPHFSSSIGEHFRHWLDLFHALQSEPTRVNYNLRRRGHPVERQLKTAHSEIAEIKQWMIGLTQEQLSQSVVVETETQLSCQACCELDSTFARELTFATLHATHHFAMAKVIASLQGIEMDAQIGVAPTTATHLRAQ